MSTLVTKNEKKGGEKKTVSLESKPQNKIIKVLSKDLIQMSAVWLLRWFSLECDLSPQNHSK